MLSPPESSSTASPPLLREAAILSGSSIELSLTLERPSLATATSADGSVDLGLRAAGTDTVICSADEVAPGASHVMVSPSTSPMRSGTPTSPPATASQVLQCNGASRYTTTDALLSQIAKDRKLLPAEGGCGGSAHSRARASSDETVQSTSAPFASTEGGDADGKPEDGSAANQVSSTASLTMPGISTRAVSTVALAEEETVGNTTVERRTLALLERLRLLRARCMSSAATTATTADATVATALVEGTATGVLAGREPIAAAALRLMEGVGDEASTPTQPSALTAEDRSLYLADPVHVTSAAVDLLLKRVAAGAVYAPYELQAAQQHRQRQVAMTAAVLGSRCSSSDRDTTASALALPLLRTRRLPTALPARLDMPLADRCSFCQKHDAMCAKDHSRWNARKAAFRRAIAWGAYSRLPNWKRHAMLLLTAAYGSGSFAKMQLLRERAGASLVQGRVVLLAAPPAARGGCSDQLPALQRKLAAAGAVHPAHLAALLRSETVLQALLECGSTEFLPSSTGVDPLTWLDELLVMRFAKVPGLRAHLSAACARAALRCGDGEAFDEAVAEVAHAASHDLIARWWAAVRHLISGAWVPCIRVCDGLLEELGRRNATKGDIACSSDCDISDDVALTSVTVHSLASLAAGFQRSTGTSTALSSTKEGAVTEAGASKSCRRVTLTPPPNTGPGALPLRRLSFATIRDNIFPYCDAQSLWCVYEATRAPLLRAACTVAVRALPPAGLTGVLMRLPGFPSLLADVATHQPTAAESAALQVAADRPLRPLGVLTTAVDGFGCMTVRVSAVGRRAAGDGTLQTRRTVADLIYDALVRNGDELGGNNDGGHSGADGASASSSPQRDTTGVPANAVEVILSRHFHIAQLQPADRWLVRPVDSWAVDLPAMRKLASYLRTCSDSDETR